MVLNLGKIGKVLERLGLKLEKEGKTEHKAPNKPAAKSKKKKKK